MIANAASIHDTLPENRLIMGSFLATSQEQLKRQKRGPHVAGRRNDFAENDLRAPEARRLI
jgi:hypothetical protein